jgi:hypothetical protein
MTLVSFAHDELQTALLIATVLGVLVFVLLICHTARRFCRDMDEHDRTLTSERFDRQGRPR